MRSRCDQLCMRGRSYIIYPFAENLAISSDNFRELRDILDRVPDIALVIYGSSAWNGFHTFFLPNNKAFMKVRLFSTSAY